MIKVMLVLFMFINLAWVQWGSDNRYLIAFSGFAAGMCLMSFLAITWSEK